MRPCWLPATLVVTRWALVRRPSVALPALRWTPPVPSTAPPTVIQLATPLRLQRRLRRPKRETKERDSLSHSLTASSTPSSRLPSPDSAEPRPDQTRPSTDSRTPTDSSDLRLYQTSDFRLLAWRSSAPFYRPGASPLPSRRAGEKSSKCCFSPVFF